MNCSRLQASSVLRFIGPALLESVVFRCVQVVSRELTQLGNDSGGNRKCLNLGFAPAGCCLVLCQIIRFSSQENLQVVLQAVLDTFMIAKGL